MGTPVGDPVTNADLVGNLIHTLSGTDADSFSIDSASGQLQTAELLDYEVRSSYALNVDIQHDDGTASIAVTISVLDVEEPGVLSVTPTTLRAGTVLRARLADPDGGMSPDRVIWGWSVSTDGINFSRVKTGIPGHFSRVASEVATFTPNSNHVGKYLKVDVKYRDRRSPGHVWNLDKSAEWTSTVRIEAATSPPALTVRPLVSGLTIPWDIAFTPDGTMLITERGGKIYSRRPDGQMQRVEADVSGMFTTWEVGLMGIAVDPSFNVSDASFGRFYTCMAVNTDTGPEVQVIKWDMKDDFSEALRVDEPLVSGIPLTSQGRHGGCRIRFGPDGYLWITTGDGAIAGSPQDLTSLAGKVLRVDPQTGAGASDNPFTSPSDSRIYTYGHRNPQGLAFRPGTNQVWAVEHGPDRDDEINLLTSGGNYGWDPTPPYNEAVPMTDLAAFPEAIEAKWQSWYPAIAPSGAVFLDGAGWGDWNGRLAVALLKVKYLKVFEFSSDGALLSEVLVPELDEKYGRLRSPVMGPDGVLYITTSNGSGNDHILQVFGPSTPRVSGPDSVEYVDQGTGDLATFTSHHLTTPVTWTLSGQDAEHFSISAAGVLSFDSPPDLEDPKDADGDNVYRVLVEAQAANDGPTAERAVAVKLPPPPPEVSILGRSGVTEGGSTSFLITANPAPAADLDVSVTVSQSGNYGATIGTRTVTIPTTGRLTLTVGTTNDDADEPDGSVTATLDTPVDDAGYTVSASRSAATVSVADDDDPGPVVSITASNTVTEGGHARFVIIADPAPTEALVVSVTVSQSGDYAETTGTRTVTIPPVGSTAKVTYDTPDGPRTLIVPTEGRFVLTVATTNDDAQEADGSITATLDTPASDAGYTVSASQVAATVSVADDDTPPTPNRPRVSVTAGRGVTEGGDVTFTVTANPAPASAVNVSVTLSISGDYGVIAGQRTVTIPTTGSARLTVGTTNDDVDEPNGSVTATLDSPAADAGYTVSKTQGAATVSVSDDDLLEISISASQDGVTEGEDASFTITANPAPPTDLDVSVTVWQNGNYGAAIGAQTVTIPTTGSATLTVSTVNDEVDEADGRVTVLVNASSGYTPSSTRSVARVTVSDDDGPTPTTPEISITPGNGISEGGDAGFTITASPAPAANLDVSVTVSQNGDYGATTGKQTVTIPTSGSFTLTVSTTNDDADETDGSVTATLDTPAADAGYTVSSSQGAATVAVSDDDVPEISVTAGDGVTEGGDATFTITASPAPAADLDVSVTVSASGDYGATTGKQTVTIPTSGSFTLTVSTTNDDADEANGSVTATLDTPAADAGYTVSTSQGAATVAVSDDDEPTPEVSISAGSGVTEGGDATFTVTASPVPTANLDVSVTVSQSGDYGATTGAKTVTVPTSGSATFTVGTTNDQADEPNGSVTATLVDGADYDLGTSKTATVNVADNDDPPVVVVPAVTISGGNGVTEGGDATFTLSANPAPSANLSVTVTVSASGDYGASTGAKTVTVPTSGNATFTVGTTNDQVDEPNGSVTVTLVDGADYNLGTSKTATVAVADDDDPPVVVVPVVTISGGNGVTEGGNASFTVTATPSPSANLSVTVTVSASGDFGAATGTKTVTVSTSGSATFTVGTTDDSTDETDGSVTATLVDGTDYDLGTSKTATVAVADDDLPTPTIEQPVQPVLTACTDLPTIAVSDAEALLGDSSADFTISLDCKPSRTATAYYVHTREGSIDGGAKIARLTSSEPSHTVSVEINGTRRLEVRVVYATGAANYRAKGSLSIVSERRRPLVVRPPTIPVVSISGGGGGVTEGGDATFTVTASPAPTANLDVSVTVSASGDFGATTGTKTVTVSTSGIATFTVGTTNDQVDEPNGSVTATLVDGTDYNLGTSKTATVAVADNDDPPVVVVPVVTISGGSGVTEGGSATFTLSASPAPIANLSVTVTVGASGDFGATTGSKTVTVPASGSATFTVGTTNDQVDEPNGSVTATLVDGADYNLDTSKTATVAVADNDAPPVVVVPVVTISGGSGVTEGGSATFTLSATPAPSANLSVTVTVSASGDYGATTGSKTVTVPTSGSATFTVGTTNDQVDEPNGSVTATLVDGADYNLGTSKTATVAVADNDDPPVVVVPVVTISGGSGVTEGGDATFTLSANPAPASNLSVSVTVSASGDFGATTGTKTVTVSTSGSATFTVGTTNDQTDEPNGSITVTLVDGANYDLGVTKAATVAVSDDDVPELSISAGGGITEGGAARFTITATPVPASPITVKVGVSQSGEFGASGAATITVSGGSTTYTVSTSNDQVDEADGSVTATLQDDSGYTVFSGGAATVAVADDDDPPVEPDTKLSVSIDDASGTEGTYLEFIVRLSRASTEAVVVNWNTATAPYDEARTGGRAHSYDYAGAFDKFVFKPGVTERIGEVWLEPDGEDEPDEYFAVELFLGEGWKFRPDATGIMTILNAD